jgi:hypothetical protein
MRLPDDFLKAVFFVCVEDQGRVGFVGTGFFVSVPLAENPDYAANYAVTARHVIERASAFPSMFLRLNDTANGVIRADIRASQWVFPDDPAVDVAIMGWAPPADRVEFVRIHANTFATEEVIEREGIGIGDDIAIVGLFAGRIGAARNRPIARVGNIAAMPDEPLVDDSGHSYNAFLVEVRSIGGLSGSPVFVMLEPGRIHQGAIVMRRSGYLLGMIRGHWDTKRDAGPMDFTTEDMDQVNMGIAIVTPLDEIQRLLNDEPFAAARKSEDRRLTQEGKSAGNRETGSAAPSE